MGMGSSVSEVLTGALCLEGQGGKGHFTLEHQEVQKLKCEKTLYILEEFIILNDEKYMTNGMLGDEAGKKHNYEKNLPICM